MKLISYNINGIRAAIKKGLLDLLKENDFDIVGFQELKANVDQFKVSDFEALGYHCHWYSAQKKGYSGVGLISKQKPDLVETGIGIDQYDNEGRVIRADFGDLTVLNCYFPSGSSGAERQAIKIQFLSDFTKWVKELRKTRPNLIIMGDYNVAHDRIDVYNPDKANKSSGFLPEEREWMTEWLDSGFTDAFRHANPELQEFSWWSYRRQARANNNGWRIDYFSVSDTLKDKIKSSRHIQDAMQSDHCPVFLEMSE